MTIPMDLRASWVQSAQSISPEDQMQATPRIDKADATPAARGGDKDTPLVSEGGIALADDEVVRRSISTGSKS
jgi:hypothetical protein